MERLFSYSVDEVPTLAGEVGGIQRPRVVAPNGGSFDIGELTSEERVHDTWKPHAPSWSATQFQDEKLFADPIGLSRLVDDQLHISRRLRQIVFPDGRNLPDSFYCRRALSAVGRGQPPCRPKCFMTPS